MEIEKRFISNYLSKRHYLGGGLISFLIISLCLVLSLFYWDQSFPFSKELAGSAKEVFEYHHYWKLFTSTFVHGGVQHLAANSFMLGILIYFVSSFYGAFVSINLFIFGGALINLICLSIYGGNVYLIGASGSLYLFWGFWLALYIGIETRYHLWERVLRSFGVFLILLVPTQLEATTSYLAHYVGFVLGVILGGGYFFIKRDVFKRFEFWEYRIIEEEKEIWDLEEINREE